MERRRKFEGYQPLNDSPWVEHPVLVNELLPDPLQCQALIQVQEQDLLLVDFPAERHRGRSDALSIEELLRGALETCTGTLEVHEQQKLERRIGTSQEENR